MPDIYLTYENVFHMPVICQSYASHMTQVVIYLAYDRHMPGIFNFWGFQMSGCGSLDVASHAWVICHVRRLLSGKMLLGMSRASAEL
jgi:hypothetical protein